MGAGDGAIFTRKRADVSGHQVSYLVGGREGDMEPVLYLHGMGGAGKWEAFHMALGTVAHTFAPQLPGWTAGEPPDGIEGVQDYADLALGFLDAVELEKVALVGHSIGGWMALYLATQHPERVSRLVLADSMGLDLPDSPVADLDAIEEETFGQKVFAKLGMVATPEAYGFGADWQNVRQGPEFERQWKGRDMVTKLLKGTYSDPNLTSSSHRHQRRNPAHMGQDRRHRSARTRRSPAPIHTPITARSHGRGGPPPYGREAGDLPPPATRLPPPR